MMAWLKFFRFVNLPTVPGDVFVGAATVTAFSSLEASAFPSLGIAVGAACVAACFLYLWGLADNDIVGAQKDGTERPIPAGLISLGAARVARRLCLVGVLSAGLVGGLTKVWWIGALGLFGLMIAYNRSKGCVAMGLCRGLNVGLGGVACVGALMESGAPPSRMSAVVLLGVIIVWTVYIGSVTKYSEGEEASPAKRQCVGFLIGALVYLQLLALVIFYLLSPTTVTRNLLLGGAAMLVALRFLKRVLPKVSAS